MEHNNCVAFLCEYTSKYGGNFIPSLLALEKQLDEKGYVCIYIFPEKSKKCYWCDQLCRKGHQVFFLDFKHSRNAFIRSLNELIKQNYVSILHVHFASIFNIELLCLVNRSIKCFFHLHSDFSAGKVSIKKKLTDFIRFRLFSKRMHFLCVSNDFVKYNPKKVTYIPNSLAVERIPCAHKGRLKIRAEHGISNHEILCLIFGWSPEIKGIDIATEAVRILNERDALPVKLGIVCGISVNREKMIQYISQHTKDTGKEIYYVYLNPTEDVFSYHEASDIFISASRSEGFSYALLEALSIGKKCLVSDIPGTSWAKAYPTVYTFQSENAEDCALSMKHAIETDYSTKDIEVMIKNIRQKYDINEWANKIIACYEAY